MRTFFLSSSTELQIIWNLSSAHLLHLWLLLFLLMTYLVCTCRRQFPLSFKVQVGEASSWSWSAISLFGLSPPFNQHSMPQDVAPVELSNLQPDSANHATRTTQSTLPTATTQSEVPRSQAIIIILQLTAITIMISTSNVLMTVSIPRIGSDPGIQPQLYYW